MRHAGDGCIHYLLVLSWISKLDVMPNRAAASQITLTVEDLIAPIAGNRDPSTPPLLVCDLLPITVSNVVHVPIQCRPICESLSGLQPSSAAWRHKPPSPGLGIS